MEETGIVEFKGYKFEVPKGIANRTVKTTQNQIKNEEGELQAVEIYLYDENDQLLFIHNVNLPKK